MSEAYDSYLKEHISNVRRGLKWIIENVGMETVRDILPELPKVEKSIYDEISRHDSSKYWPEEYNAYDRYFYGKESEEASDKVRKDFNYAWLHHIHHNPHHWQHWVLIEDDPTSWPSNYAPNYEVLEMPDSYILEMVCDWWTFSWKVKDLYSMFNWWNEHSDYILLGEETREKVIKLLRAICDKVNELGGEVE